MTRCCYTWDIDHPHSSLTGRLNCVDDEKRFDFVSEGMEKMFRSAVTRRTEEKTWGLFSQITDLNWKRLATSLKRKWCVILFRVHFSLHWLKTQRQKCSVRSESIPNGLLRIGKQVIIHEKKDWIEDRWREIIVFLAFPFPLINVNVENATLTDILLSPNDRLTRRERNSFDNRWRISLSH